MLGNVDNFDLHNNVESKLMVDHLEEEKDILISFIVPTVNRLDTLKDAIDSIVLLEDLNSINYEIIIMDNSGKTNLENESYVYFNKQRIKQLRYYVNEENLGMEGNWNRGIQLAKGKYVSLLHDDDVLANTYILDIKKCISNLENKNILLGFIKTKTQYFYNIAQIKKQDRIDTVCLNSLTFTDALFRGMGLTQIPSCGILFYRNALLDVGGFDESLHPSADQVMGVKMLVKGYKGFSTDRVMGYYRIGVNESLKKSTVQQFVIKDDLIRDYIYCNNFISKFFGRLFVNYQYSTHIEDLVRCYNSDYGMFLDEKELDYKNKYKCYGLITRFLFKVLKIISISLVSSRVTKCR